MKCIKIRPISLAVVLSFAAMVAMSCLLRATPALANGTGTHDIDNGVISIRSPNTVLPAHGPWGYQINASYGGGFRCEASSCSQEATLSYSDANGQPHTVTYNFDTLGEWNSNEGRAVVKGTGILVGPHLNEAFSFTATFQNNADGNISVRFEATLDGASSTIPNASTTTYIWDIWDTGNSD